MNKLNRLIDESKPAWQLRFFTRVVDEKSNGKYLNPEFEVVRVTVGG